MTDSVPAKTCECGCGGLTKIATKTNRLYGHIKGQPKRFVHGHHNRSSGPQYEVEPHGYDTPCWIWQRNIDNDGYGKLRNQGTTRGAHRVYYEAKYGAVPPGLQLDHLCRVRCCVRPDHLEPVTSAENSRRGTRCKLTADDVRTTRRLSEQGWRNIDIAKRFAVSEQLVSKVLAKVTWRDL